MNKKPEETKTMPNVFCFILQRLDCSHLETSLENCLIAVIKSLIYSVCISHIFFFCLSDFSVSFMTKYFLINYLSNYIK